jgi:toxin secretion/phage lysis holin
MNLNMMHKIFSSKNLWILLLSFPCTTVFKFIQTYIYSDWDYLVFLGILISIDSALGMLNAWRKHSFSSKGFGQILTKIFVYSAILITVHILSTFTIEGTHPSIINYGDNFIMTSMIIREVISIFENASLIYPGLIPAFILKRLKAFDSETAEPLDKPL